MGVVVLALSLGVASQAPAAPILDVKTAGLTGIETAWGGNVEVQQGYTVGVAGLLSSISLYLGNTGFANGSYEVRIGQASALPATPAAWLFDQTIKTTKKSETLYKIDLTAANINVTVGEDLVIDLVNGATDEFYGYTVNALPFGQYGYSEYKNNGTWLAAGVLPNTTTNAGVYFEAYVNPATAVPEPTAVTVLGAGLIGLGLYRFRQSGRLSRLFGFWC